MDQPHASFDSTAPVLTGAVGAMLPLVRRVRRRYGGGIEGRTDTINECLLILDRFTRAIGKGAMEIG